MATKLFPSNVNEYDDFDKQLNLQLSKLQTDHIYFYLLHGINRDWWPKLRDLDVLEWAEKAIKEGWKNVRKEIIICGDRPGCLRSAQSARKSVPRIFQ